MSATLTREACPPANRGPAPIDNALAGTPLALVQDATDTQPLHDEGHPLPASHRLREPQMNAAGGHSFTPTPNDGATPNLWPAWGELRLAADLLERAMAERIAIYNMLGLKADGTANKSGPTILPDAFVTHAAHLAAVEAEAAKMLAASYKRVVPQSIQAWAKSQRGIGASGTPRLLARLLGRIGDPAVAVPYWWEGAGETRTLIQGEPYARTVSQLWQYCGHGAPAQRAKGMSADELAANGSPTAKMLVHLMAEATMKCKAEPGSYRELYDLTRLAVADKVHTVECRRCGPSGKPAQPGSPWALGHQHAHALRIIGKTMLRDLWLAAQPEVTP